MIFRSRRRRNESPESDGAETDGGAALDESGTAAEDSVDDSEFDSEVDPEVSGESQADADEDTGPDADDETDNETDGETDKDNAAPTLAELDAQDWRDLGPYDVSDIDTDALEVEIEAQARIDLGSMVLTPTESTEVRLQVDEASQQVVSAMIIHADSALEVGAFAAPRSGGLWAEVRDELVQGAHSAGGSADLVAGPFGVELRRLLPVRTPDGQEGYQPSRMWVAEGPRWMLRGIIYGQAALQTDLDGPVGEFLEAFRNIVVRRGDEAMAPGDLLPLSLPEGATPAAPAPGESGEA